MVTAMAVIGEVIPLRDRGRYQGALGAVFGVTTVIGPLLGGFFTDHLSWRWAFWINVPVAIAVLLVAASTIPALGRAGRPTIDYAGITLVGLGATGLTLATSWGGSTYQWSSPVIVGLFIGSAVALAAFAVVELRVPEPVLPIRLFADPVFTVCCVLSFVVGFAMLGAHVPADLHAIRRRCVRHRLRYSHVTDGGRTADHLGGQRNARGPNRAVQRCSRC